MNNGQKSKETQEKQEQLAKNLGKVFSGINGTGHKDIPKPLGGPCERSEQPASPTSKGKNLSDLVYKNLQG